jgi:uncharacterized damage-inducible protein DinB
MNTISQPAAKLSEQQQELLARLSASRDRILAVFAGVPDELSRTRPSENAWSVLDCAEHVAVAERGMFTALEKRRPTDASPDTSKDALILAFALNRTQRLAAPERAHPTGKFSALGDAINDFRLARERTMTYLQNTNEDLRKSTAVHPFGTFDCYQFVLIMALHAERHALQIEEIKNSPAYQAALNRRPIHS